MLSIEVFVAANDGWQREFTLSTPSCRIAELPPSCRAGLDELTDGLRQRLGIAGGGDQAGITDDIRAVSDVRHNTRDATGHRLADGIGKTLGPSRRGARDIKRSCDRRYVLSFTQQEDLLLKLLFRDQFLQQRLRPGDTAS